MRYRGSQGTGEGKETPRCVASDAANVEKWSLAAMLDHRTALSLGVGAYDLRSVA